MRPSPIRTHSRLSRRGVSAIEFSLWLPVLIMFVSAIVDWGYYMAQRASVSRGVMEGCRAGATVFEPSSVNPPGSDIKTKAQNRTSLILGELGIPCPAVNCQLSVDFCENGDAICNNPPFDALQVRVELQFEPFFGWVPTAPQIDERFVMATEHQR